MTVLVDLGATELYTTYWKPYLHKLYSIRPVFQSAGIRGSSMVDRYGGCMSFYHPKQTKQNIMQHKSKHIIKATFKNKVIKDVFWVILSVFIDDRKLSSPHMCSRHTLCLPVGSPRHARSKCHRHSIALKTEWSIHWTIWSTTNESRCVNLIQPGLTFTK